jgi:hypothetical protein
MTQEPKDSTFTAQANSISSSSERDRIQLERLGKKPVLKVSFKHCI